jgi:hypothetical protein
LKLIRRRSEAIRAIGTASYPTKTKLAWMLRRTTTKLKVPGSLRVNTDRRIPRQHPQKSRRTIGKADSYVGLGCDRYRADREPWLPLRNQASAIDGKGHFYSKRNGNCAFIEDYTSRSRIGGMAEFCHTFARVYDRMNGANWPWQKGAHRTFDAQFKAFLLKPHLTRITREPGPQRND